MQKPAVELRLTCRSSLSTCGIGDEYVSERRESARRLRSVRGFQPAAVQRGPVAGLAARSATRPRAQRAAVRPLPFAASGVRSHPRVRSSYRKGDARRIGARQHAAQ